MLCVQIDWYMLKKLSTFLKFDPDIAQPLVQGPDWKHNTASQFSTSATPDHGEKLEQSTRRVGCGGGARRFSAAAPGCGRRGRRREVVCGGGAGRWSAAAALTGAWETLSLGIASRLDRSSAPIAIGERNVTIFFRLSLPCTDPRAETAIAWYPQRKDRWPSFYSL
jgi:hypothetical protein